MEIFSLTWDFRLEKILIAAAYAGIPSDQLSVITKDSGHDIFTKKDISNGLSHTFPVLKTKEGVVFCQSNAILRYFASLRSDLNLYGSRTSCLLQMAAVDQWLDFVWNDVEIPMLVLNATEEFQRTVKGYSKALERALHDITSVLKIFETHLQDKVYLVGTSVTIADLSLVCAMKSLLTDTRMDNIEMTNVRRYLTTCLNQPEFKSVLSSVMSSKVASLCAANAPAAQMVKSTLPQPKFKRNRLRVKEFLAAGLSLVDEIVTIKGWAKTIRSAGAGTFAFLEINDGSIFTGAQVVLDAVETEGFEEAMACGGAGASLSVLGKVIKSPAKGQEIEIKATKVIVLGTVEDNATYPMSKKRHTLEHMRKFAHLRPRANLHAAAMRMRSAMAFALHQFFNDRGFLYIHTPLITASDCEGAGEMFAVTTLLNSHPKGDFPKTETGEIDYTKDFFDRPAFLTVSGQLNVETHCCALSDCYTFGPTFRAENSNTTRHLAEFWMLEPEIAFADLNDDMNLAEDMLKYVSQYALENCKADLAFFDKNVEKGLIKRLETTVSEDFIRLTYTEAIEILSEPKNAKKAKFEVKPKWGDDLGSEHERFLTEVIYKKAVCIYNYPKAIKAFYMRLNDDNETVAAVDVLVPNIGEIIGGSQREDRLDVLKERIIEATGHNPEDYAWYTDLRKYGTIPHAGFGLGFERLIRFVTGIENIRDVIPFPRWPGNADF